MESFSTPWKPSAARRLYATKAEARRDLFGCLNGFYNPSGLHLARDEIRPSGMERGAA